MLRIFPFRHALKGHGFSRVASAAKPYRAFAPEGRTRKPSEDGYILLGVLILLVIFVIAMSVALPKIAESIQRDREVETMYRGKQYIRAIQLYYRKFNAYPPSIDALVKTNEIRFLRKRYTDPMTGKDDWKPIAFCQNKAPIAMGFFGQPLGAASGCGVLAGTGPSGGNGIGGTSVSGGAGSNNLNSGSIFNNSNSSDGQNGTPTTQGSGGDTSGQNGQAGKSGQGGQTGSDGSQAPPTDPNSPTGGTSGGIFGDSGGPTFGGGGIIGVRPAPEKPSILVYKKKTKYNEWEFTYSKLMDQPAMIGGGAAPVGGGASPIGGTPPLAQSPIQSPPPVQTPPPPPPPPQQ